MQYFSVMCFTQLKNDISKILVLIHYCNTSTLISAFQQHAIYHVYCNRSRTTVALYMMIAKAIKTGGVFIPLKNVKVSNRDDWTIMLNMMGQKSEKLE